jgi:cytidine deaminase
MNEPLSLPTGPELIFGLVAPIGVDLDLITDVLDKTLQQMDYSVRVFRLTQLMREVPTGLPLAPTPYIQSYTDRIAYANEVRRQLGDNALAASTISAIRTFRAEERRLRTNAADEEDRSYEPDTNESAEETPLPRQSYIIRQIKRPEEVILFRRVYGRQFILVSAYTPQETRKTRIQELERQSRGGLISEVDLSRLAHELVVQDANEVLDRHGQNVRDAFPLGDVFIDASTRTTCEDMIRRFIHVLFGSNEITPSHDEYGMYMAKSASLRSSDLSRQVGAAVFRASGEIVTLGCNEVPKAGGGTYWSGEPNDSRDFVKGHDPNELRKTEVLVDIIDRLHKGGHLSVPLMGEPGPYEIAKLLLKDESDDSVSESRIMELLEFGRIIHAEMSAICDAARKGISIEQTTLYCTTFPCHICAKHIVASGITRVVYLEPYPKSYASDLHRDSISVDNNADSTKVKFEAFIGISPFRYRDIFEKGRRKYSGGAAQKWNRGEKRPMMEVYFPSYFKAETQVVAHLRRRLEELVKTDQKPETRIEATNEAHQPKLNAPPPPAQPSISLATPKPGYPR